MRTKIISNTFIKGSIENPFILLNPHNFEMTKALVALAKIQNRDIFAKSSKNPNKHFKATTEGTLFEIHSYEIGRKLIELGTKEHPFIPIPKITSQTWVQELSDKAKKEDKEIYGFSPEYPKRVYQATPSGSVFEISGL